MGEPDGVRGAHRGSARRSRSYAYISYDLLQMPVEQWNVRDRERHPLPQSGVSDQAPCEVETGGFTLMIRNIPFCVSQAALLQKLREYGFGMELEFVYLPVEFGRRQKPVGKGFAFAGFRSQATAEALVAQWQNTFVLGSDPECMPLNISKAHTQGMAANLRRWGGTKTKRIRNSHFRPWTANDCDVRAYAGA